MIYKQVSEFFEPILSKYECGFRKSYSAPNCLLVMVGKWKKCIDKEGTDWFKAFGCLPRNLSLAKLNAYSFNESSQEYTKNYLIDRKK